MRLQEVFDKVLPHTFSKRGGEWTGEFKAGAVKYNVFIDEVDDDLFNIIFEVDGVYDVDKSKGITGTGGEFQVFATVAKMVGEFIKKEKPLRFTFAAKEKSRRKVYDRFAKLVASKYRYKVKYDTDPYSKDKMYIFSQNR